MGEGIGVPVVHVLWTTAGAVEVWAAADIAAMRTASMVSAIAAMLNLLTWKRMQFTERLLVVLENMKSFAVRGIAPKVSAVSDSGARIPDPRSGTGNQKTISR